jgi:hypothetical protein
MRFWSSGALRYVKSEERTPLERVTANKWGSQFSLSAISCRQSPMSAMVGVQNLDSEAGKKLGSASPCHDNLADCLGKSRLHGPSG